MLLQLYDKNFYGIATLQTLTFSVIQTEAKLTFFCDRGKGERWALDDRRHFGDVGWRGSQLRLTFTERACDRKTSGFTLGLSRLSSTSLLEFQIFVEELSTP